MKDFEPDAVGCSAVNALALGRAADLAYKDAATVASTLGRWGMRGRFLEAVRWKGDTQAFVGADPQKTVIAFRGTGQPLDFVSDAEFNQAPLAPSRVLRGRVHFGFQSALDVAWPQVKGSLAEFHTAGRPLWVTGHSLGAAIATLAVARLAEEGVAVRGLYTFGSPRVGDHDFADTFDRATKDRVFRFVNHMDAVPRVPLEKIGSHIAYAHVGRMRYFDGDGVLGDGPSNLELLEQAAELGLEAITTGSIDRVALAVRLKTPLEEHAMARYLVRLEAAGTAAPRRRTGLSGWLSRLFGG